MGPEQQDGQQPARQVMPDPFEAEATITVVLWDDTVEVVTAGSAAVVGDGLLVLYAGGASVPLSADVMVAQYAPGSWRSWYAETDGDAIDLAMDNRHPFRTMRWRIGAWIVRQIGRD